jgi:hypothetical protein
VVMSATSTIIKPDLVPRINKTGLGYAAGFAHHDVGRDDSGCIALSPPPTPSAGLVGCLLLGFGTEGSEVFQHIRVERHHRARDRAEWPVTAVDAIGAREKLSRAPTRFEVRFLATHTVIVPASGTLPHEY